MRNVVSIYTILIFVLCYSISTEAAVSSGSTCTIISDLNSERVIYEQGACQARVTPASTFKIALALIGYDNGFLIGPHDPTIDYRDGVRAPQKDRKPVDPVIWLRDSIIWYSREITSHLGSDRFAAYVRRLDYGNRDVSGDPGRHNGLTNAWVSSSLRISPVEQVSFLTRALKNELPLSVGATDFMTTVMPSYEDAVGHTVIGKTGSGWLVDDAGMRVKDMPVGWFVGWVRIDNRTIVFAQLKTGSDGKAGYLGPRVRQGFLAELPRPLTRIETR